jgi:hypothetical protein
MKLRFHINNKGKKTYTMKEGENTHDAHYKFLKIRDAPKSNKKFIRKN